MLGERHGPRRIDALDIVVYGAAAIALYYVWKYSKRADEGINMVADWIARPIAYVINKLTLPGAAHIPGGVIFQDGGYVSWDAIIQGGSQLASDNTFTWNKKKYRALARRSDGNYPAIPV